MEQDKNDKSTKQVDLSDWVDNTMKKKSSNNKEILDNKKDNIVKTRPRLAFGYGYDPNILRHGINKFSYSHSIEDGLKLYNFKPKLSFRIFIVLAKILKYKCIGSELKKENTIIKNNYFITDKAPDQIINELNIGIKKLFELYEPISKYDIT